MQPQGGSSGTPSPSGCGTPPRDSSLPVATVLPQSPIPVQVQEAVPLEQLLEDLFDQAKRGPALVQLAPRIRSVPDISFKIRNNPWMLHLIMSPLAMDEMSRDYFLQAQVLEDLYPFLKNLVESMDSNFLRLTSLGVIAFLVKQLDIQAAVEHLLQSEIVTLCIRCMKVHSCESTILVAVVILEKILTTEIGLASICDDQERYLEIIHLLASMFKHPHITPSLKLLKWVVSCFYLFSNNPSVSKSLHKYLPDTFKDGSFRELFRGDNETLERVYQAISNA